MKLIFGNDVLVLPKTVVNKLGEASADDVRVLLCLASDLSLADRPKLLAKLATTTEKSVRHALTFWSKNGVLSPADADAEPVETPTESDAEKPSVVPTKQSLPVRDEAPVYNTAEITALLEKHAKLSSLLDEVQNLLGRMLTMADTGVILSLSDYRGLSNAFILTLCAYCAEQNITNVRTIEKKALAYLDRGVNTSSKLDKAIREDKEKHALENEVRKLFGMGARTLTSKEQKFVETWQGYGYGFDIVRIAYDITVNATGEASMPYANAVLEKWHVSGLKTKAEIEAYVESQNREKQEKNQKDGKSYDPVDFFNAALARSLEQGKEER